MKKYSGWQAVYMSFFSGDIYRDVARNWRGVGYLYLLCLVAGTWAVIAFAGQLIVNTGLDKYVQPVVSKWPTVTVKNGKLSIDKPTPYIIPVTDKWCIDFDRSDDAKLPAGMEAGYLFTPSALHQIDSEGTDKSVLSFDQLGSSEMVFDQATLQGFVSGLKQWFGIGLFVLVTPAMTLFCMVQTLLYALIGLIVSNVMNIGLTYGQLVRISSVALTPGLVLEAITRATGHPVPIWGLIAMAIAIGYVIFGVRANSVPDQSVTTPAV